MENGLVVEVVVRTWSMTHVSVEMSQHVHLGTTPGSQTPGVPATPSPP